MHKPKNILITGASSGLGAALARAYASEGHMLYITGRNETRLHEVVLECRAKGAQVQSCLIDVTDREALAEWITDINQQTSIDLVIANAGVSAGTLGGEGRDQVAFIFKTNVDGVMNTIHPLIDSMKSRKSGHIVIISSLAGLIGLPSSPAYSSSKAAVRIYGEALRGCLSKDNVGVTVVTPGYIRTPMTDLNEYPMPGLMDADKAAGIIQSRLQCNPARISFPWFLYRLVWLVSVLPLWLTGPILSRLPGKANQQVQEEI